MTTTVRRFAALTVVSLLVFTTGSARATPLSHHATAANVDLKRLALDKGSFPGKMDRLYISVHTASSDIDYDSLILGNPSRSDLLKRLYSYGLLAEEAHLRLPEFQRGWRIVGILATTFPTRSEAVQAYMDDRGHLLFDYNCKSSVVFNPNLLTNCKTPAMRIPHTLTTTCAWSIKDVQADIWGSDMLVAAAAGNVDFVVEASLGAGPTKRGDLQATHDLAVHDASVVAEHEAAHVLRLLALGVTGMKKT